LQGGVTITLPAKIKGAGKALADALRKRWNYEDVKDALSGALESLDVVEAALTREIQADPGKGPSETNGV